MRSAFDFAPYRRSTVGFDRLFDMLENSCGRQTQENYPPFDLIKLGDNDYRIELAVAGFKPDEIDITAQQNVLIVSGRKYEDSEEQGDDYIYRGIATRSFERRFALADHIQVKGADLKDGLLAIELVREIPEAMKPRKIDIGGSQERSAIGGGKSPPPSRRSTPKPSTPETLPAPQMNSPGETRLLGAFLSGEALRPREQCGDAPGVELGAQLAVGTQGHRPHPRLVVDHVRSHRRHHSRVAATSSRPSKLMKASARLSSSSSSSLHALGTDRKLPHSSSGRGATWPTKSGKSGFIS